MVGEGDPVPEPQVSVVIPTVRVDKQLREAIRSVLEQDLQATEVIVVGDGCDLAQLREFDDPRLVLVDRPDRRGTATTLNEGIRVAKAPLIGRVDADDVIRPGRLRRQVQYLDQHPEVLVVGSSAEIISESGTVIGDLVVPTGTAAVRRALHRRNPMIHSSIMMRREAVERVGGYEPRCVRMQDYDLMLRVARVGDLDNLPERLTGYRVHAGQHSRKTPPWSASMRMVLRSRKTLRREDGIPAWRSFAIDVVWLAAQTVRHIGLRRPSYLTAQSRADS
jgi:hypothetical protein